MLGTVLAACVTLVVVDSSRAEQRGIWLTSPANGAVVSGGGPVGLEFGTDWLTGVFLVRLMLQVARDPSFTDLVVDTTYECGELRAILSVDCDDRATRGRHVRVADPLAVAAGRSPVLLDTERRLDVRRRPR